MVRSTLFLAALLAALLVAPSATAEPFRISEPTTFDGNLTVPHDPRALQDGFLLLSGGLRYDAHVQGAVVALQTDDRTALTAEHVQVYSIHDPASIGMQRPLYEATDARLVPRIGSSFLWSLPEARVETDAAYTVAFLFQLEQNLPSSNLLLPARDGDPPASLIAEAQTPWHLDAPGADRSLLIPVAGGLRITGADGTEQRFDGDDWLLSLRGNTTATIGATGIAVPFPDGTTATMARASDADFAAGFDIDRLQAFLGLAATIATRFQPHDLPTETDPAAYCAAHPAVCGGDRSAEERAVEAYCRDHPEACAEHPNVSEETLAAYCQEHPSDCEDAQAATRTNRTDKTGDAPEDGPSGPAAAVIPPEVVEALGAMGPFLNGALVGRPDAALEVGGATAQQQGFTLLRFTSLTMGADGSDTMRLSGTAPFAYTGGEVYHETPVWHIGPLVIPILSVGLYIAAIAAWAATRVWTARPEDATLTHRLHMPARMTQWGLLAIAFVLFDREVHFLIGQSIFSSLSGGDAAMAPAQMMALSGASLIFVLQLGLWAAASAAFGLPIALLGRSALKAAGLGRATYGFAFGTGALATWALGTQMILPLMDLAFGTLSGAGG